MYPDCSQRGRNGTVCSRTYPNDEMSIRSLHAYNDPLFRLQGRCHEAVRADLGYKFQRLDFRAEHRPLPLRCQLLENVSYGVPKMRHV